MKKSSFSLLLLKIDNWVFSNRNSNIFKTDKLFRNN